MISIRLTLLPFLFILIISTQYPLYQQCDSRWAWQQMGTSFYSICDAGSLLSSLAMSSPRNHTPSTLNKWLKSNGKYRGYDISLTALDPIGLAYQNKISNANIKVNLDQGNVVIPMTIWGYVLAEKYEGNVLFVKDPTREGKTQYPIEEIVDGTTVVFKRLE